MHEVVGCPVFGGNGFSDRYGDQAGFFDECVFGPAFSGVDGNGDDGCSGFDRQSGSAVVVFSFLADRYPRSLGKDDDPEVFFESLAAFFDELAECVRALSAIDGYPAQKCQCPAKKRDIEQFFFQDE